MFPAIIFVMEASFRRFGSQGKNETEHQIKHKQAARCRAFSNRLLFKYDRAYRGDHLLLADSSRNFGWDSAAPLSLQVVE